MFNYLALSPQDVTMIIIWTVIAIAAIVIEFETANLVSIWFAAGGIAGIVLAIFSVALWIQILVFALVSLVFVIATRPLVKKISDNKTVLTNSDRFVGMMAQVTKEIKNGEKGEIKIDFQYWGAIAKDDKCFNVGDKVIITGISGNKMIVDSAEEIKLD